MPKFPADTMLERFIRKNKLTLLDVAYEANISRQQLLRIRKGDADPTFRVALRIRDACSRLLGRFVSIDELFGPTDPQAVRMRAKRGK
jgi:transcriptional regulator with XRE-family HTH domain